MLPGFVISVGQRQPLSPLFQELFSILWQPLYNQRQNNPANETVAHLSRQCVDTKSPATENACDTNHTKSLATPGACDSKSHSHRKWMWQKVASDTRCMWHKVAGGRKCSWHRVVTNMKCIWHNFCEQKLHVTNVWYEHETVQTQKFVYLFVGKMILIGFNSQV